MFNGRQPPRPLRSTTCPKRDFRGLVGVRGQGETPLSGELFSICVAYGANQRPEQESGFLSIWSRVPESNR